MSTNKVYSKGQVPFAWENKPGIRKEDRDRGDDDDDDDDKGKRSGKTKLPPPPYLQPESGRASPVNLQNIPLPPCAFQSPISRSGSKRDAYKEDADPFLIAYKKCTDSGSRSRSRSSRSRSRSRSRSTGRLHKKKNSSVSVLSCKHSCSVRDDSIVRISQLPLTKPTKDIIGSSFKFDD